METARVDFTELHQQLSDVVEGLNTDTKRLDRLP